MHVDKAGRNSKVNVGTVTSAKWIILLDGGVDTKLLLV